MANDAHPVHGRQLPLQLLLQKAEQLFQSFQLPDCLLLGQARLPEEVLPEFGIQHGHVGIFIRAENILNVFQAVTEFLYAFFNIHDVGNASRLWFVFISGSV